MAETQDCRALQHMVSNSTIISAVYLLAAALLVQEEEGADSTGDEEERGNLTSANLFASELLEGSDARFHELFCMAKDTFHALCAWIEEHTGLRGTRYQRIEHKVMVFLWICAHAKSQRAAARLFRASQSSVSVTFRHVLGAVRQLHAELSTQQQQQPHDGGSDRRRHLSSLLGLQGRLGAILEAQDADGRVAK